MGRLINTAKSIASAAGTLAVVSVAATKIIDSRRDKPAPRPSARFYERHVKRPLDFALASFALAALSPVIAAEAVAVRVKLGKPVFFRQTRPGLHERPFEILKFRTMIDDFDENGVLLPDSQRMTTLGHTLRELSLDELPELINIIVGDMAVVGPRPQLVRDMVFMTSEQRKRHTVRPGLTGLAQANGRNTLSWENRLAYDIEYIRRITFMEDCKIVIHTVGSVLRHNDTSTEGMETSEDLGDYLLRVGAISYSEYQEGHDAAIRVIGNNTD